MILYCVYSTACTVPSYIAKGRIGITKLQCDKGLNVHFSDFSCDSTANLGIQQHLEHAIGMQLGVTDI